MQMAFGEGDVRLLMALCVIGRDHFVRVLREEARAAACTDSGICQPRAEGARLRRGAFQAVHTAGDEKSTAMSIQGDEHPGR